MPSDLQIKAVIDTNVVVSAFLFQRGAPYEVLSALHTGAFSMVVSERVRREYAVVLARPNLIRRYNIDTESVEAYFRFIDRRALMLDPVTTLPIDVRDPKDEHILAAALGGGVDFLVSGDADLLSLAGDPRLGSLRIVTARDFLAALGVG